MVSLRKSKSLKEDKPKEDKPKAASKSVTLDDLNDDPKILETLTPKQGSALHLKAEESDIALGGIIRSRLNGLHNQHVAETTND